VDAPRCRQCSGFDIRFSHTPENVRPVVMLAKLDGLPDMSIRIV
jgi:hypothetical protein